MSTMKKSINRYKIKENNIMNIKSNKLKMAMHQLQNTNVVSIMRQFSLLNQNIEQTSKQVDPAELVLDAVIQVSQYTDQKKEKKAKFVVCDKWLKPTNVFSIISTSKQKKDQNVWILFYDSNIWYIRKGLKAASTVHVKLISTPETDQE